MVKKSVKNYEDKSMKDNQDSPRMAEQKFYYPRESRSFSVKAASQEEADKKAAEIINKKLTPQEDV